MSGTSKTILLAALGLAIVASSLAAPALGAMSSIGPRPSKAVPITLYASFTAPAGWGQGPNNITEPGPTLTVQQGDAVTFQLFANDSTTHQLIIDVDNSHSNTSGDGWSYPFSSKTTAATFTYTANTARHSPTSAIFTAITFSAARSSSTRHRRPRATTRS